MREKPDQAPIKNESTNGLKNERGTLAMARTSVPDSAASQFFINVKDNDFLNSRGEGDPGYAVFGKVIEGMDMVDKIKAVQTGNQRGMGDVPFARRDHGPVRHQILIVEQAFQPANPTAGFPACPTGVPT